MVETDQDKSTYSPAGDAALIGRYDLDVIPNWHQSLVTAAESTGSIPPRA